MRRFLTSSNKAPRERRGTPHDRRRGYWKTLWSSLSSRRRTTIRRANDPRHNVLSDHHEAHFFALIVTIILLCVADAFLTVTILARGGVEVNPVMRALLEIDVRVFFAVKYLTTAVCLVLALTHRRFHAFRFLNGEHVLWWTFAIYVALVNYEVILLNRV